MLMSDTAAVGKFVEYGHQYIDTVILILDKSRIVNATEMDIALDATSPGINTTPITAHCDDVTLEANEEYQKRDETTQLNVAYRVHLCDQYSKIASPNDEGYLYVVHSGNMFPISPNEAYGVHKPDMLTTSSNEAYGVHYMN